MSSIQTTISRGPPAAALTTIWTPPCGTAPFLPYVTTEPSCFPPKWSAYLLTPSSGIGYYSPAICPSGFTPGCTRFHSQQGPDVLPEETAWNCVLSGYTCETTDPTAYLWGVSRISTTTAYFVFIHIRWQSSDLAILETHPLTPGLRVGARVTPTLMPEETLKGDGQSSAFGLSTGAKAGIGVGVVIAVLLLCGAALFFIRRYRAKRLRPLGEPMEWAHGPGELSGDSMSTPFFELGTRSPALPLAVKNSASPTGTADPKSLLQPTSRTGTAPAVEIDSNPRQNLEALELPAHSGFHPPPFPPVEHVIHEEFALHPVYSDLPEVKYPDSDAAGLEVLRARQTELDTERQRLLRLQEIEEEQARLKDRIAQMGDGLSGPSR